MSSTNNVFAGILFLSTRMLLTSNWSANNLDGINPPLDTVAISSNLKPVFFIFSARIFTSVSISDHVRIQLPFHYDLVFVN